MASSKYSAGSVPPRKPDAVDEKRRRRIDRQDAAVRDIAPDVGNFSDASLSKSVTPSSWPRGLPD